MWSTSLSMDTSGTHLQTQTCTQNTSREQTRVSDQRERYTDPCKTQQDEGTRGKNRSVSTTGPALGRWGNRSRGPIPTSGQLSESEEKQLNCGGLNEMRIR